MKTYGKYERITFFICYFLYSNRISYDEDKIYTIKTYSEDTGIPLQLARNDLYVLFSKSSFLGVTIDDKTDKDLFEEYKNRMSEGKSDNSIKKAIEKVILDGKYDSAGIEITEYEAFLNGYESIIIPFSFEEKIILGNYLFPATSPYHIKRVLGSNDLHYRMELIDKIKIINEAVSESRFMTFNYWNNTVFSSVSCLPTKLLFDSEVSSNIALLSADGEKYYLQNIRNIQKGKTSKNKFNTSSPTSKNNACHFKIQIYTTTNNIKEKIESDIRRAGGKLEAVPGKNDIFIYEGDSSDFNNFKRWIQGYGSSVKILEPQKYADEIKEDSEKILRQYSTGKFE